MTSPDMDDEAMKAMARRIAEARVPDRSFSTHAMVLAMRELAYDAALAAIIETQERCAALAESAHYAGGIMDWTPKGIAAAIRSGQQFRKDG